MKKRMANMELLRILAMMMVVLLHNLSKGELLQPLTGDLPANSYAAWFLEAFAIVAVNVYMLISGYFLVEAEWKWERLLKLWIQVWFYSMLIPVLLLAAGVLSPSSLSIYRLLQYALPTQMEHYWFISAYVITYLFTPVLSAAVKQLSREQLRNTVWGLLLFFSVSKSVLPFELTADKLGYDALWFMCVFLVAAYVRKYGIAFFSGAKKSFLVYLCCSLLVFGETFLLRMIYLKTGSLGHFIQSAYSYNHVLNLLGALALFYTFYHSRDRFGGVAEKVILAISPYTLGVYLLHEHIEVRTLWPKWLGVSLTEPVWRMVLRAGAAVLLVFTAGIFVDFVRSLLFRTIGKLLKRK